MRLSGRVRMWDEELNGRRLDIGCSQEDQCAVRRATMEYSDPISLKESDDEKGLIGVEGEAKMARGFTAALQWEPGRTGEQASVRVPPEHYHRVVGDGLGEVRLSVRAIHKSAVPARHYFRPRKRVSPSLVWRQCVQPLSYF